MGLLTITPQAVQVRRDPGNPQNIQVGFRQDLASNMLRNQGIFLQVEIGVDNYTATYLQNQGMPIPQPYKCTALVDTGASCLCIDTGIATQLALSRRGIATSLTANGARQSNVHAVSISFPGSTLQKYDVIRASDVNLSPQPFKCLIGRDIMSRWHVHYNGQTGTISIAD